MIAGLQTIDRDGMIRVDLTGNYPKQLLTFHSGLGSGVMIVEGITQGRPWVSFVPDQAFLSPGMYPLYPQAYVSAGRVYWNFYPFNTATGSAQRVGGIFICGIY